MLHDQDNDAFMMTVPSDPPLILEGVRSALWKGLLTPRSRTATGASHNVAIVAAATFRDVVPPASSKKRFIMIPAMPYTQHIGRNLLASHRRNVSARSGFADCLPLFLPHTFLTSITLSYAATYSHTRDLILPTDIQNHQYSHSPILSSHPTYPPAMRLSSISTTISLFLASSASAQTYSKCNPTQQTCPADKALGTTSDVSFTSGQSSDYSGTGNGISYGSSGAQLTVSRSGDNPTLTSNWYIMFGKVDFVMKAAPGTGMVSSAILISDDLDEIDWELLGTDSSQAQTNYFSKGVTGSYDRGSDASVSSSQSDFNTYTIDWNAEQTTWQINGETVRTLTYASTGGQYPQTPMQVKVGAWAGGDSSNSEGTIEWAGGAINYASGPYSMYVQSINVQDYSTGSEYKYEGSSGSWQDITAVGGSVGSSGSGSSGSGFSGTPTNGDTATATWTGTHENTSAFVTPSTYPWVPASSAPSTGSSSSDSGPPASSYLATLGYDTSSAPAVSKPLDFLLLFTLQILTCFTDYSHTRIIYTLVIALVCGSLSGSGWL